MHCRGTSCAHKRKFVNFAKRLVMARQGLMSCPSNRLLFLQGSNTSKSLNSWANQVDYDYIYKNDASTKEGSVASVIHTAKSTAPHSERRSKNVLSPRAS
eukprot:2855098-Amphidinium_carterae.2